MSTEGDTCECGAEDWYVRATIISCRACGRLWGRVNGRWVLDPDTVPDDLPRATARRKP